MISHENIWWSPRAELNELRRQRFVAIDAKAVDHNNLALMRDKVLECVPEGTKFHPYLFGSNVLALLPKPGTERYASSFQVSIYHPSFDEVPADGFPPIHDKQILADGTIAEQTKHLTVEKK